MVVITDLSYSCVEALKPLSHDLDILRRSQLLFSGENMIKMSIHHLCEMSTHLRHFWEKCSNIWNNFLMEEIVES